MEGVEQRQQHQPIKVYDELQVGEHGRPACWL
jgi:hypothetical protein